MSALDGRLKSCLERPTIEEMVAADPSEATRSAEILEVASDFFEILGVRPYGGTILRILLDDVDGDLRRPGSGGRERLAAIADLEWALIGSGDLDRDFVVVAKAKG